MAEIERKCTFKIYDYLLDQYPKSYGSFLRKTIKDNCYYKFQYNECFFNFSKDFEKTCYIKLQDDKSIILNTGYLTTYTREKEVKEKHLEKYFSYLEKYI